MALACLIFPFFVNWFMLRNHIKRKDESLIVEYIGFYFSLVCFLIGAFVEYSRGRAVGVANGIIMTALLLTIFTDIIEKDNADLFPVVMSTGFVTLAIIIIMIL